MPDDEAEQRVRTALAEFEQKSKAAWRRLFDAARDRNQVYFAISLMAEFRGMQDAGWNTAEEAKAAFLDYSELLAQMSPSRTKMRIALSWYSHLSEAAGFYEVPKNMLRVAGGESYHLYPFNDLARYRERGMAIAPNANKIMQDMLAHASELGFDDLRETITEAFDPELRNGYAHADYIIWGGELRLRRRYGGFPRTVSQEEFALRLNKAIAFFETLWQQVSESMQSFAPPVRTVGRLNNEQPEAPVVIEYHPERQSLSIRTGGVD